MSEQIDTTGSSQETHHVYKDFGDPRAFGLRMVGEDACKARCRLILSEAGREIVVLDEEL